MTQMSKANITSLADGQNFVFGSNLNGFHAGGAAKLAYENFGAEWGNPIGQQGRSYAIPTLDKDMKKIPLEIIKQSLEELFQYADEHKDEVWFLTPIATGIAGYSMEDLESILPKILPENINPTWR